MLTESQARSKAEKLLAKMKSPGWEIRVWENLGWHYSLQRGTLNVLEHEYQKTAYHIFYSEEVGGVSEPSYYGICNKSYDNPNLAVEKALQLAARFIKEQVKVLNINRKVHGLGLVELAVINQPKVRTHG